MTFKKLRKKVKYYGIVYLFSPRYRELIKYLNRAEINRKHGKKMKAKYGSGFLSSRKSIKLNLIKRDGRMCKACKRELLFYDLTIDHIEPVKDGGTNAMWNLQLLCNDCHAIKSKSEE